MNERWWKPKLKAEGMHEMMLLDDITDGASQVEDEAESVLPQLEMDQNEVVTVSVHCQLEHQSLVAPSDYNRRISSLYDR